MMQLRALWGSWRRDEQWTIVVCLILLSLFGGITFARSRTTAALPPIFREARATQLTAPSSMASEQSLKSIMVHVVGAVRKPGLVVLPASSRVVQAVEQAGGATKDSNVQAINLAAILKDGQQIAVPFKTVSRAIPVVLPIRVGEKSLPHRPAIPSAGPVNINTATVVEMDALPGVGPAIAARIVEYRKQHGRFEQLEDLDAVKGIGVKKLEKMRAFVRF